MWSATFLHRYCLGIFGGLIAVFLIGVQSVYAQGTLSLSPAEQTGSEFTTTIELDTGSDTAIAVDVVMTFNPSLLEVTEVAFGNLFPERAEPQIDNVNGRLGIHVYAEELNDAFAGTGTLATVQFSGKSSGTSPINFSCTPQATNESNILKYSPRSDILDCSIVGNGSFTVVVDESGSTAGTPTPTLAGSGTPTLTLTPTPTEEVLEIGSSEASEIDTTPTPPQELLTTADFTPTLTLAVFGAIFLLGSLFLFIW